MASLLPDWPDAFSEPHGNGTDPLGPGKCPAELGGSRTESCLKASRSPGE